MSKIYDRILNILATLFFLSLLFSEWHFIGLPINGRPLIISFNDYLSISAFEIILFILFLYTLPLQRIALAQAFKEWPKMVHWVFCILFFIELLYFLKPNLPYLTPKNTNIINEIIIFFIEIKKLN